MADAAVCPARSETGRCQAYRVYAYVDVSGRAVSVAMLPVLASAWHCWPQAG
jgi:hypothetical protein